VSHPRHELDGLLGHPVRYSIVALLAAARRAEFGFVRDEIELSDSVLSKQVSALEEAGYVKVDKGFIGKRARTWLSLTREGRARFDRHLAALRRIASGASNGQRSGGDEA
jgi:DNA-binding MarR family transcriptional regulator